MLKKIFTAIIILLSITHVANAKQYYYYDTLEGLINGNNTFPFCSSSECTYSNTNSIDVNFTNNSVAYDVTETNLSQTFTLDEGTGNATLRAAVSGSSNINGDVVVSKASGTITIPGFSAAGTANITLIAEENGKVVDRDYLEVVVGDMTDDANAFITTWEVRSNETIIFPTTAGYLYNGKINWGDGTASSNFTSHNDANLTHTFSSAGTYTVTITGTFEAMDTSRFALDTFFPGEVDIDLPSDSLKIKTVEQLGRVGWKSLQGAFISTDLTSFNAGNSDTSKVTNMGGMFAGSANLTNMNLSGIKTTNVTDMSYMFYDLWRLPSIDSMNFETSKVKNMSYMFFAMENLSSLNLSSFNTPNTTNMSGMFIDCYNLASLDVSKFDTSNVTNMSEMFSGLQLLELNLSNFNTSNVSNMHEMFYDTYIHTSLNMSSFDTSNVTNMSRMFARAEVINGLNVAHFKTLNVTNMYGMFEMAVDLTSLDVSTWDTSKVTNTSIMFVNNFDLATLDISGWDISSIPNTANMIAMFCNTPSLTLDLSHWGLADTSDLYSCSFR